MRALLSVMFIGFACFLLGAAPNNQLTLDASEIRTESGPVGQVIGSLTMGQVGEDAFLGLGISASFISRDWRASMHVPLRLRVHDAEPKHSMMLRMEDWDEISDFARLLPLVQYGHAGDPVFVRLGELRGLTLGHGTLVYRYHNNARLNTYRGGVYGRGDWTIVGTEVLVDDFLSPSLAVLRTFSRPFARLGSAPSVFRKMRFGLTTGADFRAPTDVQIAQLSEPEGGHYVVRSREKDLIPMLGFDLELPIWESDSLHILSYADLNSVDLQGLGLHVGLRTEIRFTPLSRLTTRLEYQLAGDGYLDRYISPFYEVERWSHRSGQTKLAWFRTEAGELLEGTRHGFNVETEYHLSGWMNLMLSYGDTEGQGNSHLLLHASLPEFKGFRCALTYANLGFEGLADLADSTGTVFGVSARYQFGDHFYMKAQAGNEWWLNQEPGLKKEFETTFNYDIGVGALITL